MPMGWGRALAALGGGLSSWADDLTQQRARQQSVDSQLSSRGYFRREPKAALEPGSGVMESMRPAAASDPMLDAVAAGGGGRTLVPGMRPQPLSATMGMDTDFGDVGPEDPRAYAPDAGVPEVQPATVRPSPERLMALKTAVRSVAPKDYTEVMDFEGQTYDYQPERTPEGRRAALQEAVRDRQNREAFRVLSRENEGVGAYSPQIDYGNIGERRLGDNLRGRVDPASNRRYFEELNRMSGGGLQYIDGFDYRKGYEGAVGRENAQNNQREIRIEFPRQGGGGDGLTSTQERSQRRSEATGRAQTLALEAYANGHRNVVGYVRNYLRQEFPDITEGEIEGIAATQVRINEPDKPRGRRGLLPGSGTNWSN